MGRFDGLAAWLQVVSNPVRLERLDTLREPKSLGDIRVRPHRQAGDLSGQRAMARQSVKEHLDRLLEIGLVQSVTTPTGVQYGVQQHRLFAMVEEIRALSTLRSDVAQDDHTLTMAVPPLPTSMDGPRLVLVHGVYEGRVYPLVDHVTIGRGDVEVRLDYDPYVSLRQATVADGRLVALGKNPTTVNWRQVEEAILQPGDVIGVGRSRLVFTGAA